MSGPTITLLLVPIGCVLGGVLIGRMVARYWITENVKCTLGFHDFNHDFIHCTSHGMIRNPDKPGVIGTTTKYKRCKRCRLAVRRMPTEYDR